MANETIDGGAPATYMKINGDGSAFDATVTKVVLRPSRSWDPVSERFVDVPVKTKDGRDRDEIVLYGEDTYGDNVAFSFLVGSPAHRDLQAGAAKSGRKVSELVGHRVSITHKGRKGPKPTDAHIREVRVLDQVQDERKARLTDAPF